MPNYLEQDSAIGQRILRSKEPVSRRYFLRLSMMYASLFSLASGGGILIVKDAGTPQPSNEELEEKETPMNRLSSGFLGAAIVGIVVGSLLGLTEERDN